MENRAETSAARFGDRLHVFIESLPPAGGGEEIVICADPEGRRRACALSEWKSRLVRRVEGAEAAPLTKRSSPEDKVELFGRLFAGRRDVFALRFFNEKSGKSGYSPACRNKWKKGLCDMRRTKCAACPSRDLMELDSSFLTNHLIGRDPHGRDVVGVYALLKDGYARFLAADFDDRDWKEDAAAYRQACERAGLTPAVERSRSGSGAHVWLFFSEPVPAADARKLGTGLLTRAMSERPLMSFASFDRLFPSQDIVPKGGFGNLIALPLQGQARKQGNSLFVDEEYVPFDDQWAYLSSLPRVTPEQLSQVLDSLPQEPTEPGPAPGPNPPASGRTRIVFSNMLYLRKEGLPKDLLADARRTAAFPNPKYPEKLRMRLSVTGVPRYVDCSLDAGEFLALPRGCRGDLVALLKERGVDFDETDEREPGRPIDVSFAGVLREEQEEAARKLLEHDSGVLSAATGFGKTVVGAYLIAERKVNTLIAVPSSALLEQWKEALGRFLDIRETPAGDGSRRRLEVIGQLGAGKRTNAGIVDVATFGSLRDPEGRAKELVGRYGMVICDECHHAAAFTFEQVLRGARAKYVYGLSATPARADGLDPIIFMQCGPVRHAVSAASLQRGFSRVVVPRFTRARIAPGLGIQDAYAALFSNAERNARIVTDAAAACGEGRTPLVLTNRVEHAAELARGLEAASDARVFLLCGSDSPKMKREKLEALRGASPGEKIAVVATGRHVGEGFDLPRLDTLLVAAPVSWKGVVAQYAGRLHRDSPGKTEARIYDYVDVHVPQMERMYRKRQRSYLEQGYEIRSAPGEEEVRSRVFSGGEYLRPFADDLGRACEEVYLCGPGATMERLREIGPLLAKLREAGVPARVRLGKGDPGQIAAAARYLKELGAETEIAPGVSYSAAIIDRRVVWYGAVSFLGEAEGDALRFESRDVAGELLEAEAPGPRQLSLDLPGS